MNNPMLYLSIHCMMIPGTDLILIGDGKPEMMLPVDIFVKALNKGTAEMSKGDLKDKTVEMDKVIRLEITRLQEIQRLQDE